MTRVLHLYSGNMYGGVETYLATLARLRHLVSDLEPHFALCFPGRLRDELAATGVAVHDLGRVRFGRPWTLVAARARLRVLLRTGGFAAAVTHGCWSHAAFAAVVRRGGVRLVNSVHDALTGRHRLERWAARTPPDLVLANSRFTAAAAAAVFPRSPIEVLYLPVEPPRTDAAAARREVRSELDTPVDAVVTLQASRMEAWKGHATHLEALGRLTDLPGWVAWFAGGAQRPHEAEYLSRLKATADRLGIADRVRFVGQRDDVARLMAAADIYCQPNSAAEPFGLALVEALAAGLPVVTSAIGGAVEIVDETCGVLTPPGDADAVAKAMRGLMANGTRRRALGAAGETRAMKLCPPSGHAVRLKELLTATVRVARSVR